MATEYATVRVAQGVLRGKKITAKAGNSYFSFEGIPFARPPVGPLRFKVAHPPDSWNGIRDALKVGPSCPQVDRFLKFPYRGDEDCLYLNVYTPTVASGNKKYPVMVWIHGGGFLVGSGDMVGPRYLISEDVIVITINYRLGVFGFLGVDDELHPGNLGLKDQVAALLWVKENIAGFEGDPNNVTLFGNSAGTACVHYHLLSPLSKGLFHKVIMQSGCALNPWSIGRKSRDLAFKLANALGCNATNTEELLKYLSAASARDLVETFDDLCKKQRDKTNLRFAPTIEGRERLEHEAFLPDEPEILMKKGQFHSVPCIIGMNSQEGILFLGHANILKDPTILRDIGEHLESLVPKDMISRKDLNEILAKIKKFYFKDEGITETSTMEYVEYMSDTMFTRGIDLTAKILAANNTQVYFYHFDFNGKLNMLKNLIEASHLPGAAHLDELGYLFELSFFGLSDDVENNSREELTRKRMVRLWTNFAKTGNPTPTLDSLIDIKWPQYSPENCEYLNIRDTISVERDLYKERIEFWNNM